MTFTTTRLITEARTAGRSGPILWIVVHSMEAPERLDIAESVARYFQDVSNEASAHWCVDPNSRVRCVPDADSAWAVGPPANGFTLSIEIPGYARQTPPQWNDDYSRGAISVAARCAAEWALKYSIPVRHLTLDQMRNKEKGIVSHAQVNEIYHSSTHWDPGPNFPWVVFLDKTKIELSTLRNHLREALKVSVSNTQRILTNNGFETEGVDGIWGQNTMDAYRHAREVLDF